MKITAWITRETKATLRSDRDRLARQIALIREGHADCFTGTPEDRSLITEALQRHSAALHRQASAGALSASSDADHAALRERAVRANLIAGVFTERDRHRSRTALAAIDRPISEAA